MEGGIENNFRTRLFLIIGTRRHGMLEHLSGIGYTYGMDANDEITAEEASKILDVSDRHVRWYFAKGYLPGRRIGGLTLVFPRDAVEALKENKPKKTGRPPSIPAASAPKKKRTPAAAAESGPKKSEKTNRAPKKRRGKKGKAES